jgi:hypothetical protein
MECLVDLDFQLTFEIIIGGKACIQIVVEHWTVKVVVIFKSVNVTQIKCLVKITMFW